jgi:hypothetical protein
MFCSNCGNQIPDQSKFCNFCGAQQGNVQPLVQSSPPAPQRAAEGRQGNPVAQAAGPDFAALEKAVKKYIRPHTIVNVIIFLCIFTLPLCLMMPIIAAIPVLAALSVVIWILGRRPLNKCISEAKAEGRYEQMLLEFASSSVLLDGKIRYSEHYIWGKASSSFFAYEDIYWMYRHMLRYIVIPIQSAIMVGDRKGKIRTLCKLKLSNKSGGREIQEAATIVYNKNPHVLLGFDAARQAEYKRRTQK